MDFLPIHQNFGISSSAYIYRTYPKTCFPEFYTLISAGFKNLFRRFSDSFLIKYQNCQLMRQHPEIRGLHHTPELPERKISKRSLQVAAPVKIRKTRKYHFVLYTAPKNMLYY